MASYEELLKTLFSVNLHQGVKLGLSNVLALHEHVQKPAEQFKTIHVAGSNGKGSVVTKIAKTLELQGKKVGLYTSPHISCFRERIQINGKMIPEEAVVAYLERLFSLCKEKKIPATFFELTTLLCFLYFAQEKVDVAVIEVGLGGRLDATNIIIPELSIITSISLDHTEILGNTIEQIAKEKAGIIKPGVPVVIGPRVPIEGTQVIRIAGDFTSYDAENSAIARRALEVLGVADKYIEEGIKTRPPCRMERVQYRGKTIVLDVAHNPDGLTHLFEALPRGRFRIICGLSKTKDLSSCLNILKLHGSFFHFVEAANGRGASPVDLKEMSGIEESKVNTTIKEALEEALQGVEEVIVICGTFFIMAEARAALGYAEPIDFIDMNEKFTKP